MTSGLGELAPFFRRFLPLLNGYTPFFQPYFGHFWPPVNGFLPSPSGWDCSDFTTVTAKVPMLKNQGAQDIVRYNYWKDVRRIEALRQAYAATIAGGLAVMVTNDPSYQKSPTSGSVGYGPFSIEDGRVVKQPQNCDMSWQNGVSVAKDHPNFQIFGNYSIKWQSMPKMNGFSYIIL